MKRTNIANRFFGFVLCMCMVLVLSLCIYGTAGTVNAADPEAAVEISGSIQQYDTLQDALDAASRCTQWDYAVVTLLRQSSLEGRHLTINSGVFTIDLGGATISGTVYISGTGTDITIENGSVHNSGGIGISVDEGASATINECDIVGATGISANGGHVTFSGSIDGEDYGISAANNSCVTVRFSSINGERCGITAHQSIVDIMGTTVRGDYGVEVHDCSASIEGEIVAASYGISSYYSDVTISGNVTSAAQGIEAHESTVMISNSEVNGIANCLAAWESTITLSDSKMMGNDGVVVNDSNVMIENVEIESSNIGINVSDNSDVTVLYGTIKNSQNGVITYESTVTLSGCSMSAQKGVYAFNSSITVNDGANISGDVGMDIFDSMLTVSDSHIECSSYGLYVGQSDLKISESIIGGETAVHAYEASSVTLSGGKTFGVKYCVNAVDASSVTFSGGEAIGGECGIHANNGSSVDINGGSIHGTSYGVEASNGSSVTVSDCSIESGSIALEVSEESTLTVSSGHIRGTDVGVSVYSKCTANLSGADIFGQWAVTIVGSHMTFSSGTVEGGYCGVNAVDSTVVISGGNITAESAMDANDSNIMLLGGFLSGEACGVRAISTTTVTISGGAVYGNCGIDADESTVLVSGGDIQTGSYGIDASNSTVLMIGGNINAGDFVFVNDDSSIILSAGEYVDTPACFYSLRVSGTTLNHILGKGMAYWLDGKQIELADDVTELSGEVVIKEACDHSGNTATDDGDCTTELLCTVCSSAAVKANQEHSYQEGICTVCGTVDPNYVKPSVKPTLTLRSPTLEFKDMICIVAFYTAENTEDVVEMGMITYTEKVDAVDINTAAYVIPGATYESDSGRYFSSSQGIHAKYLGDTVYLACYAKLTDGTYVYSKLAPYSAVTYATNQLKNSTDMKVKQLVAAMLNYGAAAQLHFGHNVNALANASLTDEQKTLPDAYRADMVSTVPAVAAGKQGGFTNNQGFSSRYPAISFEGAFCINYFFTPNYAPQNGITLYYWNAEDCNAASVLTTANATGYVNLEGSGTGEYRGDITGIAAKNISEAAYVAAVYSDGTTTWASGVLGYSIGAYCSSQASKGGTVADLAMATAVYGYHAKQYFG